MCYIYIHLTMNPFTFNTDCIKVCTLLYMIVIHEQNVSQESYKFIEEDFLHQRNQ